MLKHCAKHKLHMSIVPLNLIVKKVSAVGIRLRNLIENQIALLQNVTLT